MPPFTQGHYAAAGFLLLVGLIVGVVAINVKVGR